MKKYASKAILCAFPVLLLSLGSCKGTHESQGQRIGKKIDKMEKSLKDKAEDAKEVVENAHENAKKKAHDLIDKS